MGKKGETTKERILSAAENLILQKGFAGTSIDEIISAACITKGGFFYHFDSKDDLAVGLLNRYLTNDDVFFSELEGRAAELSEDPLQQLLIFLKLLAESMAELPALHPGCLVATFVYENLQVNDEVRALNRKGVLAWQTRFADHLGRIMALYEPAVAVSRQEVADMLIAILEGGIIVSRAYGSQQALVDQILQYRNYMRLLFSDVRTAVA